MPTISIVIPTYNSEQFLSQAIESVLAQSFTDWELVVVDDGSLDGSYVLAAEYARRDPRVRVTKQSTSGPAVARNRGIEECSQDSTYVAFLDSDDFWYRQTLETLLRALDANEEAVAAYGLPRPADASGEPTNPDERRAWDEAWERKRRAVVRNTFRKLSADDPTTFAALIFYCWISTPGLVLIRRAALDAVGAFDPQLVASEDWDPWIRLSLLGNLIPVPEFVLRRRMHGNNLSQDGRRLACAETQIRCKLTYSPRLSREQRCIARRGLNYWYVQRLLWAASAWMEGNHWEAITQDRRTVRDYCQIRLALYTHRGTQCAPLIGGSIRESGLGTRNLSVSNAYSLSDSRG